MTAAVTAGQDGGGFDSGGASLAGLLNVEQRLYGNSKSSSRGNNTVMQTAKQTTGNSSTSLGGAKFVNGGYTLSFDNTLPSNNPEPRSSNIASNLLRFFISSASAEEGEHAIVENAINTVQGEFPDASIRITGRARTTRRQAELMADRVVNDSGGYVNRPHIQAMILWRGTNPNATREQIVVQFDRIIQSALADGDTVSNHLSNTARDISIPRGTNTIRNQIEGRFNELGVTVLREPDASEGPHWHLDQ